MCAPDTDYIDMAFLQLSFAIKLWHFLDNDPFPIKKDDFDISLTIDDPGSRVCLTHNEFETDDHLKVVAENNVSIAFGAVAITLWEEIRKHSRLSPKDLDPQKNRAHNLAALSYMIRCCFAHGAAEPVWSIQSDKYKTEYQVGNKTIDLSQIADKQAFDYASIDGFETLWHLMVDARAEGLLKAA